MKTLAVKMDRDLLELVDLYAINNKLSRSEVIRQALMDYLNS